MPSRLILTSAIACSVFGQTRPPSGGMAARVAFVGQQDSVNHIYLMDVDASGRGSNPTRLTNDVESESYAFWSPDGKRLVYQRAFHGSAVYVINADGTGQQRLSPAQGFDTSPFWSPDGAKIVYARLLSPPQPNQPPPMTDIRVMNVDGTGDHAILSNTIFSVEPQWSVNDQIVFMSYMSSSKLQIFVMNADGTGLRQLTNIAANNGDPVWSPDGTRITFGSDREGGNKLNVFTMNADGSQLQQLTHFDVPYEAGNPNWSGDGKKISFQYDINGMKQSDPNARAEVWTMNPDGSGAAGTGVQCSNVGCNPTWQPRAVASNAQIVVMSGSVPGPGAPIVNELVTMNLDGSNRKQVTSDGKNKFLAHFSPDGTRLLYTKFLTGAYGQPGSLTDLAVYDFASAKETLLTSTGKEGYPVWSPDGKRIAWLSGGSLSASSSLTALKVMNADGSSAQTIASASSAPDNLMLGDPAWSSDNWILFVVGQNNSSGTCFKARMDKIRPDGSARTEVTDGGPNCSRNGVEPSGDADPGFSADGQTIYTSRGFPNAPAGGTSNLTERRLYAVSSEPWFPGKPETDLSLPTEPSCIEGVPKGSPDGKQVLLFRACFGTGTPVTGVFITDTAGSYRTKITDGFGPDWNPATTAAVPRINSGGIVIHAGVSPTVSPGSLVDIYVDIYGSNMAVTAVSAPAGANLPVTLGGVQVLVNGTPAPLIYVSATQIIFQVPYETALGTASVVVLSNTTASAAAPMTVQQAAPSILTYGNNRALVANQDNTLNAAANGATPGSALVAYLIGSGPLDNPIATGTAAPSSPLSREKLATTVSVGGSGATVQFAGMTPGFAGLVQINFAMPNLAPGDYPMQVIIGSAVSNRPLLTVGAGPDATIAGLIVASDNEITGNAGNIYVIKPGATGKCYLTNNNSKVNNTLAAWSFDGTKVTYTSNQSGTYNIWTMDANGDNPKQLTFSGAVISAFSPDGNIHRLFLAPNWPSGSMDHAFRRRQPDAADDNDSKRDHEEGCQFHQ